MEFLCVSLGTGKEMGQIRVSDKMKETKRVCRSWSEMKRRGSFRRSQTSLHNSLQNTLILWKSHLTSA